MELVIHIKLTNYGIHSTVVEEICSLFRTGQVSPLELNNAALDALNECDVSEAIRVIKTFSEITKGCNVKNKSDFLCGMIKSQKQRQKQASRDMLISQRDCFQETLATIHPDGQLWQPNTNQCQISHWYDTTSRQQHYQYQRKRGYTKQANHHQGYKQHPNQYQGYKQSPHQQKNDQGSAGLMPAPLSPSQYINIYEYMSHPQEPVQYDYVPVSLSSGGAPRGQEPTHYPLSLMGQCSSTSPHGHLNIIDHQSIPQKGYLQIQDIQKSPFFKRGQKGKQKTEKYSKLDSIMQRFTDENDFIFRKLTLLNSSSDDDVSKERGGRRRQGRGRGRGGSWRRGRGGQNKLQDDRLDLDFFENIKDEDEVDGYASQYFRSINDLLIQRSKEGFQRNRNLLKNFGSIDSMSGHDSILNKRGRGGNFGGRGGKTRNVYEDDIPSTDDSYQSYCGHHCLRGRGSGQRKEGRGYGVIIENRNEIKKEKENAHGRRNDRRRGRFRDGKQHIDYQNEQDERNVPDVDEYSVFKFLIKSFGGGCTFEDFLRRCDLFPNESNIRLWFKKHVKRFHVFWEGEDIVYLQPFYKDAKICVRWNNKKIPAECQNAQCEYFHICRRFIRGNCKDKDCPLSHSFRSSHNRHLKHKLDISDFSDADIKIVLNCNFPSVCADYIYNNVCKIENAEKKCPHLHLCQMKIFGKCDDPCKFNKTHSINHYHNNWVLTSCHMKGWPPAQVFDAIYVPPRQGDVSEDCFDDSDLSQNEDGAENVSDRYDFGDNVNSESLSSTESSSPKLSNKWTTSVKNLDIEDGRKVGKMRHGSRERFTPLEDILCGNVVKDDHSLPNISDDDVVHDDDNDNDDDDDIKEKESILMKRNIQEKQATSSGKVVKLKLPPRPSKVIPSDPDYQKRKPDLLKDKTENSNICMFVSKYKCPSASCKKLHLSSGIPYLWQIKMFSKWGSLTLKENEKIEKTYCDLQDVESAEVKCYGKIYSVHIWFSEGQAVVYGVNGQPAVDYIHYCFVRRLSTQSFAEKKMVVDNYLTQWRWYWKDSKKWNMYSKDVQLTLERKYLTKQKTYLYTREINYRYIIDFEKMTQVNLDTDIVQIIIRRPLFVSKDDVQQKKNPDSKHFQAERRTDKPKHFYDRDCPQDFELIQLETTGREFIDVSKSLQDSMSPAQFGIESIYRIQNGKLWSEYDMKKKLMLADAKEDRNGPTIDERDLFQGTDIWDTCRDICTNNFNFRASGRNAVQYGEGLYFTVRAKMSHSYTDACLTTGIRFMFKAKVLVGQFTKGNPSFRQPPEIPGMVHKLYDSCVDEVQNPNIFVVFDRHQCYPDYLILYTDRETLSMDKRRNSSSLQMHTVQSITFPIYSEKGSYDGEPLKYPQPIDSQTSSKRQSCLWLSASSFEENPVVQKVHLNEHHSLLTSPLLCDGLYIDCIPDKRLDTRPFFTNVKEKDTKWLLSELEQTQTHAFARLVSTSNYFKSRKSLESKALNQLLRYAIFHGSSLMCRLILSFITYNVKPEPYLIQMMFLALEKVEEDCARAISWFITRAFYLQYQSFMTELIDIWPSFCCLCSKGSNLSACSTYVVIVVESKINHSHLPEEFCQLQIISLKNYDNLRSNEHDVNNKLNTANESLHLQDNVTVSSIAAKNLFTKHSNLTLICKSFRKSTGYKDGILENDLDTPCVQLYCKAKGCIPIGEDHFPEVVCGLPTEILQGTPSLMANLKVGDKIGTDNYKTGTLGGFVKVRGDICFLTCLHVFLSAEDLASDNIALDDDAGVLVKCYRTRSDTGQEQMNSYNCGKIREIAFEMDNEKETSIDAALITINDGIQIDDNDYLASNQPFPSISIGMKSKYLNENCVDFKPLCYSFPCQNVKVVAVGAISGINKSEAQVKENNEKSIDLESMEQTFNSVILGEVKEKVGDVIKQLISVDTIPPERISLVVEQVCTNILSNECKSVILDVTKSILPIMRENSYKKMDTNDNNGNENCIFCRQCDLMYQPACECIDRLIEEMVISKTTSHLSSINSDVHMQHTYLKKTLDQQSLKRTSRRVYNQIHVSNIPFKPGDSGTCIYTVQPSAGCIGMAIANHPQSGCIATPIKEILKHFKIKIK